MYDNVSRLRARFAVAAGALALLFGTGFSGSAAAQDIVLGQVASKTNLVTGANGRGMATGINVYLSAVNAAGGIGGRQVKLLSREDDADAKKMMDATKDLIANKDVLALVGFVNTSGLAQLAKDNVPGENGIAMIAPLQGDKGIVGAENFFPFRSGYPDEVTAMIKEAAATQKKKVVVAYYNVTFGPAMYALAQEEAKKQNLNVSAYIKVDAQQPPEKFNDVVKQVADAVVKENPDAVIMLLSSKYVAELTKAIKNSSAANAQVYAMSVVWADDIIKAAGEDKARGVVIAQAVPFPYSATLPFVGEYQRAMKQYAPNEQFSFPSLEGYAAAKIAVEGIKRAGGAAATREKVVKALNSMGEFNMGGVYVDYSARGRRGWGSVDLSIIGPKGKLLR